MILPTATAAWGGWQKLQGNTPITPLLQAGFKMVIVTHLSDGSLWSRQDFPDATVIEIRPQSSIERSGGVQDLLGFDADKIPSWIEQGYVDTKHCVGRVMESVQARHELRQSEAALLKSEQALTVSQPMLEDALARLRSTR
jgi:NTE family protein